MATLKVDGFEMMDAQLNKLGRTGIRTIVEAGAAAAETRMRMATQRAGHVPPGKSGRATGDMAASIGMNEYREYFHGGSVDVYPQGDDRKGIRNADKAYILNYGRGGARKTDGMGDRFITSDEKKTEEAVLAAMQEESDRLLSEIQ